MGERCLIINADGFGFTRGVNKGIAESVKQGVVTSTSALANFDALDELPAFCRQFPNVSIGVHLNLTVGRPVSDPAHVRSLVGSDGAFRRDFIRALLRGGVRTSEMLCELDAQIARVKSLGVKPTHIDGHQNKHLYPRFFGTALRTARRHGVDRIRSHRRHLVTANEGRFRDLSSYYLAHPTRLFTHTYGRMVTRHANWKGFRSADRLITPGYVDSDHKAMLTTWLKMVDILPAGTSEIYCHPGHPDEELARLSYYVRPREEEIAVLTSPMLRDAIQGRGIRLISFKEL